MDISELKEYIYENEKIEYILTELGCHAIKPRKDGQYYSCAFPDGDNIKGLIVYNNEYLNIKSYTRQIKNPYGVKCSLIDVVCFLKDLYISRAIKWVCDILGLDYYSNPEEELPESLKWTKMIFDMKERGENTESDYLKPINKKILKYYKPYVNDIFKNDGISYSTQRIFEIGFDIQSNRYTIPIYDELGVCVGVKGRYFFKDTPQDEDKYIYLEPCAKTKVLYGLYKTYKYIKEKDEVIVVESEKSVMKAWEDGIYNIVAISGHDLSKTQVNKLTALGVNEIILCYDEDVFREENGKVSKLKYKIEIDKFIEQQKVSLMVDINRTILNKKESPIDNIEKFNQMYKERILIR
ncbi:UNVERIFIED_ORG: hypothetical protein B2H93_04420 [Clostridium botulinum]